MKLNCSQVVAKMLKNHGVHYVAGIMDQQLHELVKSLSGADVPFIQVMQEQSAVLVADGYFRACGRPMAVFLPTTSGVSKALGSIATAYTDSSAILIFSGGYLSPPLQQSGNAHSGWYATVTHHGVSKAQLSVSNPDEIWETMKHAMTLMLQGRPGPVIIDIPHTVQISEITSKSETIQINRAKNPSSPKNEAIEQAVLLLQKARRPLIIVGGGMNVSNATDALVTFAEKLSIPVVNTMNGKGAFPEDHVLCGGPIGRNGSTCGNHFLSTADVVLSIGSRLENSLHFTPKPLAQVQLIQIDIDRQEIGRDRQVDIGIVADAKSALSAMNRVVSTLYCDVISLERKAYRKEVLTMRKAWVNHLAECYQIDTSPFTVQRSLAELRRITEQDAIVIVGPGYIQKAVYQLFPVYLPRTHITSRKFAPKGWAIPAAIGAKLAMPARQVICLISESDFMQSMQELAVCVMHTIPVVFLVFSHSHSEKNKNTNIGEETFNEQLTMPDGKPYAPDYTDIARSFGLDAWRVEHASQLNKILTKAVNFPGPSLVEIVTALDGENASIEHNNSFPASAYLSNESELTFDD
ncbi:thiamine pyrophosphate-binding protein [Pectobacterium sp. A5351]|uniref:thiamine pyrophosphate-binding protein n=1 Tax=Pectobacterium sp. A5351 TaxID=2914983 RepID=UPI00232B9E91|nr:thiamine pyrophosphate-binding protein [Pectobacterium sp. A5351]WCG84647.1 thiamine pyrophosphate-binding protein [Pectobacterium sp. A5351]